MEATAKSGPAADALPEIKTKAQRILMQWVTRIRLIGFGVK